MSCLYLYLQGTKKLIIRSCFEQAYGLTLLSLPPIPIPITTSNTTSNTIADLSPPVAPSTQPTMQQAMVQPEVDDLPQQRISDCNRMGKGANLRKYPSLSGKILTVIPLGDVVSLTGEQVKADGIQCVESSTDRVARVRLDGWQAVFYRLCSSGFKERLVVQSPPKTFPSCN